MSGPDPWARASAEVRPTRRGAVPQGPRVTRAAGQRAWPRSRAHPRRAAPPGRRAHAGHTRGAPAPVAVSSMDRAGGAGRRSLLRSRFSRPPLVQARPPSARAGSGAWDAGLEVPWYRGFDDEEETDKSPNVRAIHRAPGVGASGARPAVPPPPATDDLRDRAVGSRPDAVPPGPPLTLQPDVEWTGSREPVPVDEKGDVGPHTPESNYPSRGLRKS